MQSKKELPLSYFRSVDRDFHFKMEQKLREHQKDPGHYKPNFGLVDSRIKTNVKYNIEELKDKIIEKTGLRDKAREITCCNRVLRVIEK